MIYLLPFLNAFLLYICLEPKQIFNRPYEWLKANIFPRFPQWVIKILGGCILCTATWMGILQCAGYGFIKEFDWILIGIIFYNAVSTTILYKFLQ